MDKKLERLSFRTTEDNIKHLNAIKERYDLSVGNIIHRMILSYAQDGDVEKTFKSIMK
tara:strand:+ start:1607 stop:1780 length:174 start_codon:yes stop_codon:yes gene_type:complete